MRIKRAILLIIFFCFNTFIFSQELIEFEHISTENGLSQNDVNCIYQDQQGFMWFGTHDGLNKYDGYNFTTYIPQTDNINSLSSNLVWKIIGDKNDNLWIGTTGHGLNFFNKKTQTFTRLKKDVNDKHSLKGKFIHSLFIDDHNNLWVGTEEGINIAKINKPIDSIKFKRYIIKTPKKFNGRNSIHSIYQDKNKQLWLGLTHGLYKVTKKKNDYTFKRMNEILNLPITTIQDLREDDFNNLIIGSSKGIYTFPLNKPNTKAELIYNCPVSEMIYFNSNLWVSSNKGIFKFTINPITKKIEFSNQFTYNPNNPKSLNHNDTKSIFVDRTGIIWIGTSGGGINKLNLEKKQFKNITSSDANGSIKNGKIRYILEDSNESLWFGFQSSGISFLENSQQNNYNTFKNFNLSPRSFKILEFKEESRKKLLFGGRQVIDITNSNRQIKKSNFKIDQRFPTTIFSSIQDSKGNFWVGTYNGGILRYLKGEKNNTRFKNDTDKPYSLPNNIIRDILEDKKGNIWFATGGGLAKLIPEEKDKPDPVFEVYKNIPYDSLSLSFNYILDVFESKNGTIWVGTLGGGLNKFIPSNSQKPGKFKRYTTKNGLPSNAIKGILEDNKGNLWISTNRGISKFNSKKNTFKNYDVNDGLQSNEFSELACVKRKNGELIFGGTNGFTVFNPSLIEDNTFETETVITNFSIFNKPIKINEKFKGRSILTKSIDQTKEIELKYNENSFAFDFTSLHFSAPQKNNYAYKLVGFDKDWIYTTSERRFANYTNVSPGKYVLKVKASNNDGLWDKTPVKLKINISPPFWKTKLAKAIYLSLFIGLLFALRRFTIISTSKKYNLEMEHLEKEKYEEINRLKLEFFTNISHEFRTPLTLIKGPIEYLKSKGEKLNIKDALQQLGVIDKNADYLLRLVNQLLDFRKMEKGKMKLVVGQGDIVSFIKEISEPFQFLSHKKNVIFNVQSKNNSISTYFDPSAIEKIINNLLSNAFKFTPSEGSITIEISKNKNVIIKVKDSGPGIPEHRIKHIFERYYTEIDKKNANQKGTGIGLSFVKNLVELHQGTISVVSNSENGTTFTVSLPINKSIYEQCDVTKISEETEISKIYVNETNQKSQAISVIDDIVDKNISRSRSKLPVLLVIDDNSEIRSLIKKGLGEDFYIYEAENGEKGFELALKHIPNIVITDLMMPIMNGVDFSNKLKSTKETSHIPVVMLTAVTSQEMEIEGLKTGAVIYVRKPFKMELLKLKLTNILKNREEMRKRFNREITLEPTNVIVESNDSKFLQEAIEIVEKHMMDTNFSVELLVKELHISRSGLYLKIKELTDLSCSEFIRSVRLKRAVQLLEQSDLSVKEIMYMTGFNTASYFSKCFKKQFGVIPSKYIRDKKKNNTES